MARRRPESGRDRRGGLSLGNMLFVSAVVGAVGLYLLDAIVPYRAAETDERRKEQAAIDQRDLEELARRYGMTVEEYQRDGASLPWGTAGDGRTLPGFAGGGDLFGQPLTPTYAPHLFGVSKMRPLRGAVVNPKAKKDRNLWPLNTDYDLYSLGKDGKTSTLLSSPESQDDIIRANNGQFYGLASDY